MAASRAKRVTLWVFARGRTAESARGAEVEVVEAGRRAQADQGEPAGGGYWWAEIPGVAAGEYTVRVRFPGGVIRERRVRVGDGQDQVRFDEDA